jgi:hypothetical protein
MPGVECPASPVSKTANVLAVTKERQIPRCARDDSGTLLMQKSIKRRGVRRRGMRSMERESLFGLEFERVGQANGAFHFLADRDGLAALDVAGENAGFEPVEAPGIFDGDDRVGSGNDAR